MNRASIPVRDEAAQETTRSQVIDQAAAAVLAVVAVAAFLGGAFITMLAQMGIAGCDRACNFGLITFAGYFITVVGIITLIAMAIALRRRRGRQYIWRIPAIAVTVIVIATAVSLSLTAIAL